MSDPAPDVNTVVSAELDGRTLSGAGVTKESLEKVMDARAIDDTPAESPPASGTATAPTSAPTVSGEPPQLTKGRARYSELTQQREAEKTRADAAEKKALELEARLAQPAAQRPDPMSQPAASAQSASSQPAFTRPEPTEDEIGDKGKYKTYGEFTRDQALWVWEQQQQPIQQAIRQQLDADRQQQAFDAHVENTRVKGRASYKDFDAMLANGPGTFVQMPMPAVHAILQAPNSEHLQYAIMKDGALAQRLAGLAFQNPYAFALELTKILPAAPAASPASTSAPGSSMPPAPLQPVGAGSRTTTLSSAEHAKSGDYQAYKAARAAERGGTRRR